MKKSSIILGIILLIFNNTVKSQSPFTFIYGNNTFENRSVNGISDDRGNTYILGVKNAFDVNAVGTPIEGYPVLGLSIIKLNSNGLKLWEVFKNIPMPDGSRLPSSNLIINGNRIFISYIKPMGWKECGNNLFVEYDNRGLICIDTSGLIIFDSLYHNYNCSQFREFALVQINNKILTVIQEGNAVKVYKSNLNGETILDTNLNFNFTVSAVHRQNNELLILGSQPQSKKIYISSIDSNLNTIFNKEINIQRYPERYLTTKNQNSNNVIILNGNEVISMTNDAQLLWSTLLPYRSNSIIQKSNKQYQVFSNIDSNNVPVVVSSLLNLQGNIIQITILPNSNNMIVKNVINSTNQPIYISDTSCCYLTPGTAAKIHVSNSINTTLGQEVSNKKIIELDFKVLNNKLIIISSSEEKKDYILVNMNGKRMMNGVLNLGENTLNTSGLSSGFYLLLTSNYSYKIFIP